MKTCENCARPADCEDTSGGTLRCGACCDHSGNCWPRYGCERCGEEDSETANGCPACFECSKASDGRTMEHVLR